jgi:hypothetical protein
MLVSYYLSHGKAKFLMALEHSILTGGEKWITKRDLQGITNKNLNYQ